MEELNEMDNVELKMPGKWTELPIELWLKVLRQLSFDDINNFHLVSKDFNRISNIIPQVLKITHAIYNENSAIALKNATRCFDIIKIQKVPHMSDYFDVLFNYITCNEPQLITVFELDDVGLNKLMLLEILKQMTNLKRLKLCTVRHIKTKNSNITADRNDTIELPQLESLEISHCEFAYQKILKSITKCNLTEGVFKGVSGLALVPFLKTQQKTMKRLTMENPSVSSQTDLVSLTEMDLEYLHISYGVLSVNANLVGDFLKMNSHLKTLIFRTKDISDNILNVIFNSLESLENLEIEINRFVTRISLDNLYKLRKLKRLVYIEDDDIYQYAFNKLECLQYEVNENLEEIQLAMPILNERFVDNLKVAIPNLKKLHLQSYAPYTVEYFLKKIKNLEQLELVFDYFEPLNFEVDFSLDRVYQLKMKRLVFDKNNLTFDSKTTRQLVTNFCNLEHLRIEYCDGLTERSVKILLRGLKKLKELYIFHITDYEKGFANYTMKLIKQYGRNLKRVHIDHKFDFEYVREMLEDLKGLHISGFDFNTVI